MTSYIDFTTGTANEPTLGAVSAIEPAVDNYSTPEVEPEYTEPEYAEPAPEISPSHAFVDIYPISVKSVSSKCENDFFVDIEFSVACSTDGAYITSNQYKLTKRLKFDKNKLVEDAIYQSELLNLSAKVVENKQEPKVNQRFLELAGIKHSKNYI